MNQPLLPIPNSAGVLVLGILSIFGLCCFGIGGLIMGIIALVLHKQGMEAYNEQPELYRASGLGTMNAGRICAIIGIVLSSLALLASLADLFFAGMGLFDNLDFNF